MLHGDKIFGNTERGSLHSHLEGIDEWSNEASEWTQQTKNNTKTIDRTKGNVRKNILADEMSVPLRDELLAGRTFRGFFFGTVSRVSKLQDTQTAYDVQTLL